LQYFSVLLPVQFFKSASDKPAIPVVTENQSKESQEDKKNEENK